MKILYKRILFIALLFSFNTTIIAQNEEGADEADAVISTISRYIENTNTVEIRFFPDRKSLLYLGIKDGFIIERIEVKENSNNEEDYIFKKIGEAHPFNDAKWKELISNSRGKEKKEIQTAKGFFDNIEIKNKTSALKDLASIQKQKNEDDFEYMIFILSALKNKNIAPALGLAFMDTTVEKNKEYVYQVRLLKNPVNYEIESVPTVVQTTKALKTYIRDIKVIQGDSKLSFIWEITDEVSGFTIERKDSKTNQWKSITKAPIYNIVNDKKSTFDDSNLANYQVYEYRFYGFNPFGEKVLIGSAKGTPIDLTPPKKPILKQLKNNKPDEVTIEWDIQKPIDTDLKGFIVARGNSTKGQFKVLHKKLVSKAKRKYIDKSFERNKNNYYIVQAIDTSGNISSTMPMYAMLIDSIPPSKPEFKKITIDSTGIVKLSIKLNKETDLMGYRVFRSNSENHEFSAIAESFVELDSLGNSKKVQTVFTDTVTLRSLTPKIYYSVKALDFNYNQSQFSDIKTVKRPDTIPPTTPIFKRSRLNKTYVELFFVLSKSKDVNKHFIYRKKDKEQTWTVLAELANNQTSYKDKTIVNGHQYHYSLRALDNSNLYSDYAFPVSIDIKNRVNKPEITDFKSTIIGKKVSLSWNYASANKDVYFVIYKKTKGEKLKQYKKINTNHFEEEVPNGVYHYAVRVYTITGGKSLISTVNTVDVN